MSGTPGCKNRINVQKQAERSGEIDERTGGFSGEAGPNPAGYAAGGAAGAVSDRSDADRIGPGHKRAGRPSRVCLLFFCVEAVHRHQELLSQRPGPCASSLRGPDGKKRQPRRGYLWGCLFVFTREQPASRHRRRCRRCRSTRGFHRRGGSGRFRW